MAWPKGKPRPPGAGRRAGTPNKKTNLFALCEEHQVNVFEDMLITASNIQDDKERFYFMKEILPYLHARKKEIEIDVDMDLAKKAEEYAQLSKEEQIKLMEAELKRLKEE